MKYLFVALFFFLLCANAGYAQSKEEYVQHISQLKKNIWDTPDKDFDNREIPEKYKKESAVILARKYSIEANSKSKIKLGLLMMGMASKELIFRSTLREKVLIQDKSSLEDFATISYKRLNKKSVGNFLISTWRDNVKQYIGARVYKKDGAVKEVLSSEAVSTIDDKDKKEEKLAISDLQVGDMLDYFIVSEENHELSTLDPMQFILSDEYPILKFALQGNVNKNFAVEYKSLNGAPPISIEKDENEDMIIHAHAENLDKYDYAIWSSPYRSAKLIRLNLRLGTSGLSYSVAAQTGTAFKKGELINGLTDEQIYKQEIGTLRWLAYEYGHGRTFKQQKDDAKDAVNRWKKQHGKEGLEDSLPLILYRSLRYSCYFSADANDKIFPGRTRNYTYLNQRFFASVLSLLLTDYGVKNQLIFYKSRYGVKIDDLMSTDQLSYIVHLQSAAGKDIYLADDGIFSQYDMVPEEGQGEQGVTLDYGKINDLSFNRTRKMSQGDIKLPVSKAGDNTMKETLSASLDLNATPQLLIDRRVTETGLMKEDDQKKYLLFEDYYKEVWKESGVEKTFMEELADSKKTEALASEWQTAFAKAKEKNKESFMSGIENNYGTAPKELLSFNIEQSGVTTAQPLLIYNMKFSMQNWIRKAGNNYILEVGKLIGTQVNIKEEQRTRTDNIYQPFARDIDYDIKIAIPAGYTVDGVDSLNIKTENSCGQFLTNAFLEKDALHIHLHKSYLHNFEPVGNWPQILGIIDGAAKFYDTKILLRKK